MQYKLCLALVVMVVVVVDGWSTLDRTDKSYTKNKIENSVDYNYYKTAGYVLKECKDELHEICRKYTRVLGYQKFCGNQKYRKYCKRTCQQCPAVSPLSCHASRLGCCWDNITKVSSGCPDCIDRTPACRKIKSLCHQAHLARACPQTCNICPVSPNCFDNEHQKEWCPMWKEAGFCKEEKELMTEYCPRTCNLCPQILQDQQSGNPVIEVFRKGTADMFDLPEDQKLESEKKLIKLLLEDNKQKELTNENKKKELAVKETVHQQSKKSNMVDKATNDDAKKEKLSDDSVETLIRMLTDRTIAKKQVKEDSRNTEKTKKESASIESFEALNKLLNTKVEEAKKEVDTKEASLKTLAELLQKKDQTKKVVDTKKASLKALAELLQKKDQTKKEVDTKEASLKALAELLQKNNQANKEVDTKEASLKALAELLQKKNQAKKEVQVNTVKESQKRETNIESVFNLISLDEKERKEARNTGKSMDDALFKIINKEQAEKKSVSTKEDDKKTKKEAEERLIQLLMKKESTKKEDENARVNDALFDLMKETVAKREKNEAPKAR